ncbi:hypothetical protein N5094_06685 [Shewanella putrefaciens]|uniref:lipopolysaccharide biosynthesis protein n=1 Tax=Shewanella putrefaciens TaxID=24 RepID=UPI0021BEB767|nr:hypothetical protein [Shewanella putrefaciens]UXK09895.1 hypothetical protein N5094_06685 [Shewanella putrefaciens]
MKIINLVSKLSYYTLANVIIRLLSLIIPLVSIKFLDDVSYHSLIISIATSNLIISSVGYALGVATNKCSAYFMLNQNIINSKSFLLEIKYYILFLFSLFSSFFFMKDILFVDKINSTTLYIVTLYNALVGIVSIILVNYYIGKNQVAKVSIMQTLCGLLAILILLIFLMFGKYNTTPLQYCLLLSLPFSTFIFIIFYNDFDELKLRFLKFNIVKTNFYFFKKLVIPSFLSNFSYAFCIWFVLILIGAYLSPDLAAKYGTAMLFLNLAVYIPQLTSAITVPILMKLNTYDEFYSFLFKITSLNVFISVFFLLLIYTFSHYIDDYYAANFTEISSLILSIMFSVIPISICNVFGQFLVRIEKLSMGLVFNILWAISYVGLMYIFVKFEQKLSAIPFVTSYVVLAFIQGFYIKNELKKIKY